MILPYSKAAFDIAKQTSYKAAIASAAGTTVFHVAIRSITPKRRRSEIIVVETQIGAIDALSLRAIESSLGTGDARKANIDAALNAHGLAGSLLASETRSESPSDGNGASDTPLVVVLVSVVVGVLALGAVVSYCRWLRAATKAAQVTPVQMHGSGHVKEGVSMMCAGGPADIQDGLAQSLAAGWQVGQDHSAGEEALANGTEERVEPATAQEAPVLTSLSSGLSQRVLPDENKYAVVKLHLGSSADSDLREFIGLNDDCEFSKMIRDPMMAMAEEWMQHGSDADKANWHYVTKGTARDWRDIPQHVKDTFEAGQYHGGTIQENEYDEGHDDMTMDDFVDHEISKLAGLKTYHVAVLRMYTSCSYRRFNGPLRCGGPGNPHPFKANVYIIDEAIKKLRKVQAKQDPEAYAMTMKLYRGMADMEMDLEEFKRVGGNELAIMSTSGSEEIALSYARTGKVSGMMFVMSTTGASRGVRLQYLSLYPKENEFLFPPLTNLTFDEHSQVMTKDGVDQIPVKPIWS